MTNQKYTKQERLKSKKNIGLLFEKGKWQSCGNLRAITVKADTEIPQVGVSVSKKYFKHATDRNRIKRLLRECYRLNKKAYLNKFEAGSYTMFFWVSKSLPENLNEVEKDFLKLCEH
ncbi:ribonuclease P protein component [Riemerella columbina]|uniref:ribonuclease P protein component n=1 Tax=Riemerella columbina TaxID=103810 RepID=UPI000379923F|nr:ribonuclease P protein component [Riemerella columbina]